MTCGLIEHSYIKILFQRIKVCAFPYVPYVALKDTLLILNEMEQKLSSTGRKLPMIFAYVVYNIDTG